MKERWRISKEELVSIEEGSKSDKIQIGVIKRRNCNFDNCIEISKLILYIILIVVLGWSSYILWNSRNLAYKQQRDVQSFDAFHSDYDASTIPEEVESATIYDKMLISDYEDPLVNLEKQISTLNDHPYDKDSTETDTKSVDDLLTNLWDDLILQKAVETTTVNNIVVEDSEESWKSKEDDNTMTSSQNSLDIDDSKDKTGKSIEDTAFLDWDFPFLWSIHPGQGLPTNDYTKEESEDSKFDEFIKDLYDSNENNDEDDVSESHQTSDEVDPKIDQKEMEQQDESDLTNDNSSKFSETMDIIKKLNKLLEDTRKDLALHMSLYDMKKESLMREPKTFDDPFMDNSKKSRVFFNERSSYEPDPFIYPFAEPDESEILVDTPLVDETTSDWDSGAWYPYDSSLNSKPNSRESDNTYLEPMVETEERNGQDESLNTSSKEWEHSVSGQSEDKVNDDSKDVKETSEEVISFGPRKPKGLVRCITQFTFSTKVLRCIVPEGSEETTTDMSNVYDDMGYSNEKSDIYEDSAIDENEKTSIDMDNNSKEEVIDLLGNSEEKFLSQEDDWFSFKPENAHLLWT